MITIIDYGMGNLGSIKNMLSSMGVPASISSDMAAISDARKLILPGIGAFDKAVENLRRLDLIGPLNQKVLEEKVPILGICLGMQLFTKGSEEGVLPGMGWIDAQTIRFQFEAGNERLRVPHMGWNTITVNQSSPLLDDRYEDSRYYFVHTYHVQCSDTNNILATTTYGIPFHSAVMKDNIIGTQFHPEKSHKFGLKILKNFACC